jgi:hypothetical protein
MMRHIAIAGLLAGTMGMSGCYKTNYLNGGFEGEPAKTEWRHRVVLGLVELGDPVALQSICPSGFGKVTSEVSVLNGLVNYGLGAFGLNWLYAPSTVTVWCSGGSAYRIDQVGEHFAMSTPTLDEPLPNLDGFAVIDE